MELLKAIMGLTAAICAVSSFFCAFAAVGSLNHDTGTQCEKDARKMLFKASLWLGAMATALFLILVKTLLWWVAATCGSLSIVILFGLSLAWMNRSGSKEEMQSFGQAFRWFYRLGGASISLFLILKVVHG